MSEAPPSGNANGKPDGPTAVRLAWVDNLRTLVIVLVVNMHACVTYSHLGSWYRVEEPPPGMPAQILFLFWQCHLQAFFMGLLFFLAGVFAHRSLERRGWAAFLRERARRLGLPSLLYMLVIQPFIVYVLLSSSHEPTHPSLPILYARYVASGRVLSGNGPMWFALALLAFSVLLAGLRAGKSLRLSSPNPAVAAPTGSVLIGFALILGLVTFAVRLVQPIGMDILNFQLCFFPQYIAAFALGVVAARCGWLESLATSRQARIGGWLVVGGGPLLFLAVLLTGGPPPEDGPNPYVGGWRLPAFGLAMWEQLTGVGLVLGLLAWFHRCGNASGRFATWLSQRSFAVYVLHAPVLVALTPLLRPVAIYPLIGAALLTFAGLAMSFLVADLVRRIPGLRAIL